MTEAEEKRAYRFKGKVAMVTGAASGIGRATALGFAVEGADIAICDINLAGLESLKAEVTALGRKCVHAVVNVARKEESDAFVAKVLESLGTIDILVNNAGTGQFQPFAMMEDEEYDRVMDINVRSIFNFCRAVLPTMMDKDYGKIVNITSIMSVIAGQGQSIYNTSKGAAKMMTQGMAVDLSGLQHQRQRRRPRHGPYRTDAQPPRGRGIRRPVRGEDTQAPDRPPRGYRRRRPLPLLRRRELHPWRKPLYRRGHDLHAMRS